MSAVQRVRVRDVRFVRAPMASGRLGRASQLARRRLCRALRALRASGRVLRLLKKMDRSSSLVKAARWAIPLAVKPLQKPTLDFRNGFLMSFCISELVVIAHFKSLLLEVLSMLACRR